MSGFTDDRTRALEDAAREYGRLLALGERTSREQMERKHARLMPELAARLDDVERLLGGPSRPHDTISAAADWQRRSAMGREWRSERTLFGWPLVHVATGFDPETGRARVARGIIAVGNVAIGGVALGGVAMGGIAVGGLSVGVFSLGGCAAGGLVLGGLALGVVAFGGLAMGLLAFGGLAIGHWAAGGAAFGTHVLTGQVQDPEARAVLGPILDGLRSLLGR